MTNGKFEVTNDSNPDITDKAKFSGGGRYTYNDGAVCVFDKH
jgi:hypothetical protein